MDLLVASLGVAFAGMLLIESIPPGWRKAIGGMILIAALLLGIGSEY